MADLEYLKAILVMIVVFLCGGLLMDAAERFDEYLLKKVDEKRARKTQ